MIPSAQRSDTKACVGGTHSILIKIVAPRTGSWRRFPTAKPLLIKKLGMAVEDRSQCERTYMKSTSESLSHPETSNGRAAGGNCVVARRGGEQPEADLRSQTKVNPIRFTTMASLLATGEACRMSGNRFLPHPSFTGEKRVVVDGWGENVGKVSCGSVENCPGRNPRERSRAEVSLPAVALAKAGSRHSSDEAG